MGGKGYSWKLRRKRRLGEKVMVRKELYLRREREARISQLEREWIGEDKRNRLRSPGSWELKTVLPPADGHHWNRRRRENCTGERVELRSSAHSGGCRDTPAVPAPLSSAGMWRGGCDFSAVAALQN